MKYSRLFAWTCVLFLLTGTVRVQAQSKEALQAIAAGKRATVFVDTPEANGSGFCIHASGVFVTNAHVVEGVNQVKVVLSPGQADQQAILVRVTHFDADRDLALLMADPPLTTQAPNRPPLTVLPLGSSDDLFEAKPVAVFGFPLGATLAMDEKEAPSVTVSIGRVTALRQLQGELKEIQVDAAVNPGNSGGPMIDDQGTVIGILHAGVEGAQGLNFAIPVESLRKVLRQPAIRLDLPELDWDKRFEEQSFKIQVAPFNLIDGVAGARGPFDLEMAVGYDENWRNLPIKKILGNGGTTSEFRVIGAFYQENLPLDTDLMYRIIVRQNGVVVASREDFVPVKGAPVGGALVFDGKGDSAVIRLKNWPVQGNTPHSIEMWVYPDGLPGRRAWLAMLGETAKQNHWLYKPDGDLYFGVGGDASGQIHTPLPAGKWSHVATTFGNGVLKAYVNGVLVAQTPATFNIQGVPAVPFSLAQSYMGEDFFSGAVREVRIWDHELTQADIKANLTKALSGKEPGLILYWPMDEDEGEIVHDRSGHGNDATMAKEGKWVATTGVPEPGK